MPAAAPAFAAVAASATNIAARTLILRCRRFDSHDTETSGRLH
jgi:hypothetical protein